MAWEHLDECLQVLGRFGPFQIRIIFGVVISGCFSLAWHMFLHVFVGAYPPYHCDVPIDYDQNETLDMYLPQICDDNGANCYLSQCEMFSNSTGESFDNTSIVECQNGVYWYPNEPFESTIVTQWNLFCGDSLKEATAYSVLGGGFVLGGLVFTTLSDYFGRKKINLISQVLLGMIGIGQAYLPNFEAYCVFQFLRGMVMQGVFLTAVVLISEMFPSNLRIIMGVISQVTIAVGMMLLAGLSYAMRNHQHLTVIVSAPFVLTFLLYWLIPESVPWLIITNKLEEAEYIMKKAAALNGVEIPDHMIQSLRKANSARAEQDKPREYKDGERPRDMEDFRYMDDVTLCQAFGSKRVVVNLVTLLFYWITMPLVYYGVTLGVGNLAGDVYMNFFLLSVVELPSALVCLFMLPKFGRKKTLFVCHSIASACLLVLLLVKFLGDIALDMNILEVVMAMLVKFGAGSAFLVATFYSPEVFPTPIRNFCGGLCASVGTIVNIIVPYVLLTGQLFPWLPYLIFFVCMVVSGVMVIFLPETLGRPMPQTIAELESWNDSFCGGARDPVLIDDKIDVEVNDAYEEDERDEKKNKFGPSLRADFTDGGMSSDGKKETDLRRVPSTKL